MHRGSDAGISGKEVLKPDAALLTSFESGDPATIYAAAEALVNAYRALQLEASKHRYKLNFGTLICDNCEGMKAGPDVIATCFQVKQCNFSNVKAINQDPRHLRILNDLEARSLDSSKTKS